MPGGDRTGPMGMGPMTGRAAGYCAGYEMPGYANPIAGRGYGMGFGRGRGFGMGFGRGRGWRNMFYATGSAGWKGAWGGAVPHALPYTEPTKEQELESLKYQVDYFESALREVRKQLQELEAQTTKK